MWIGCSQSPPSLISVHCSAEFSWTVKRGWFPWKNRSLICQPPPRGHQAESVAGAGERSHRHGRHHETHVTSRDVIRDRYFPNLVLTTHEGRRVRFYDDLIKDRIVTINFMYTQCEDGRCPLTTANLVRVQKLLKDPVGRAIFMYPFTLTPEHDTPSVLKKYATAYGVGP